MAKLLKIKGASLFSEILIIVFGLVGILTIVYFVAPGLRTSESKVLEAMTLTTDKIDNKSSAVEIPLPSNSLSSTVSNKPLVRIAEYAWNANSGKIVANGGPKTTKGSIMESLGVNLEIVRVDNVSTLRDMMITFASELDKGVEHPSSDKAAAGVSIMGDGLPYFETTTQHELNEKFGVGKYTVQAIGAIGLSHHEDKLIGPLEWKLNPKSMKGAVISTVIGDGGWIIALNYASLNKNRIKINPDPTTYDAEAVNFVASKDDDYINSAKELVASQRDGYTVELNEVVDGKLTGKKVKRKIDGCTTWTPGDRIVFSALSNVGTVASTRDFSNQMAATFVVIKEYALKNDKVFSNILKGAYIGGNQMKLYDSWAVRASEAVCKTYNFETPKYWYDMFKGKDTTVGGNKETLGGSTVFNYADAMQYFGITDGVNRYKPVYEQVGKYLVELNPMDFNSMYKDGVVLYDDAVNLYFLKSINDIQAGETKKADYTENKTSVMADGEWHINFASGKATINSSSNKDLESIYNLLINAENAKLSIIGHTDNDGNPNSNLTLSRSRADAVVEYLKSRGIPANRFQTVDGMGDTVPVASNNTASGKASNRRVQIKLLN
jgi:OmpA-OmpF porin, OOP family